MELKKWTEPEGGTGQSLKEDKEREREGGGPVKRDRVEKGREREKRKRERGDTIGSHLFRTSTHKDILVSASITS